MRYLVFLLLSINIFAENLTLSVIKEVPSDVKEFGGNFTELKSKDYMLGLGIIGTTLLIHQFDDEAKTFANNHKSETLDTLSPIFRHFGEFYPTMIFLAGGYAFSDDKAIKTGFYTLEAALLASGITYVSKNIFARARPYNGEGSNSWGNERFNSDYSSFPSGHSTVAFATAAVIADMYADQKGVPELAYTLATLTALSRIYDDKHWASDVFIGSAIGYLTGKAFMEIKKKDGSYIGPQSNGNTFGIAFGGQI